MLYHTHALESVAGAKSTWSSAPNEDYSRGSEQRRCVAKEGSVLPLYDFVFPDGHRSEVRFRRPISPTAAVASRNKLYRIRRINPQRETGRGSDRVRVELEKWPRKSLVLDRIYDLDHEG